MGLASKETSDNKWRRLSAEKEICRAANSHRMQSDKPEAKRKWEVRGRGAFIPAIAGILIVSFVAATEGAYGAWMLWIAVPMLMISLGYIYLINALAGITAIDTHNELLREQEEMHPKE
jgi:hypothetical protein